MGPLAASDDDCDDGAEEMMEECAAARECGVADVQWRKTTMLTSTRLMTMDMMPA